MQHKVVDAREDLHPEFSGYQPCPGLCSRRTPLDWIQVGVLVTVDDHHGDLSLFDHPDRIPPALESQDHCLPRVLWNNPRHPEARGYLEPNFLQSRNAPPDNSRTPSYVSKVWLRRARIVEFFSAGCPFLRDSITDGLRYELGCHLSSPATPAQETQIMKVIVLRLRKARAAVRTPWLSSPEVFRSAGG